MFNNRTIAVVSILALSVAAIVSFYKLRGNTNGTSFTKEIRPVVGDIQIAVMTTGVVEPQNRLEIKPSINSRIEEILVQEGDQVTKGQVLAWTSSTERAALVDAARSQGDKALAYWEQVYKQTPIISPIDGEVIVRSIEPGQTVTTNDTVLVLSDRLIVSAQFDETDIGRVKLGKDAVIALDAYPSVKIKGTVDHIAYESELVNNVTIYDVDIVPRQVPPFFRSGMSANVEVLEKRRQGVLLIPVEAIEREDGKAFVTVRRKGGTGLERQAIEIGILNAKNAEVVSGLTVEDVLIVRDQAYTPPKKASGTNPFLPFRGKKK
ncbi:MAG: efflux RND transporter periplasmic adaptor subunit [Thermodesulfobacteriota bacterium]|nr:efflux RND transporter periplasmic adaptor subunit [Thermodesulfobacteriota bacterium]